MSKIKVWSYSAIKLFEKCPASYKAAKIDRIKPKDKSPAMERGIAIHAKGERYLKGEIPNVPKEYSTFKAEMKDLRNSGAYSEKKIGITKDWKFTGFFDNDVWLRIVLDFGLELDNHVMFAGDFKTGQIYEDNEDQSCLYSCCYLFNGYNKVGFEFWYLDQGEIIPFEYDKRQKNMLKEYWESRVSPLFSCKKFNTNPSRLACRYCVIKDTCGDSYA